MKRKKHYKRAQWSFGLASLMRHRWGISPKRIGGIDRSSNSWWRTRFADPYEGREIVAKDWPFKVIERPPGGWKIER